MQVLATSAFSLQRAICILDSAGIVLGEMDAEEASKMLLLHCKSYCWLSAFFVSQRKMLFRVRPKLHYIVHQALQVKNLKLNLSSFTTFEEESFLGKIKAIICSCHGATCLRSVFSKILVMSGFDDSKTPSSRSQCWWGTGVMMYPFSFSFGV